MGTLGPPWRPPRASCCPPWRQERQKWAPGAARIVQTGPNHRQERKRGAQEATKTQVWQRQFFEMQPNRAKARFSKTKHRNLRHFFALHLLRASGGLLVGPVGWPGGLFGAFLGRVWLLLGPSWRASGFSWGLPGASSCPHWRQERQK